MYKKNLSFIFFLLLFSFFLQNSIIASDNSTNNIIDTGIDFLTDPPSAETTYAAGAGTITYTPSENNENAVITMENATINGSIRGVYYQDLNKASAALLASGNIDFILIGDNKITVTEQYTNGLFFYDSNITFKGSGSLTIDTTACTLNGPSGIDILNGKNATEQMGKFILESGNIILKLHPDDVSYCLCVSKDIIVRGGSLTIEGGSSSIVSTGGNIKISAGTINLIDFDNTGCATYNGDITVSGDNTVLNILSRENDKYSIGITAENKKNIPTISISGGTVDISSGQCGIYADYGGNITISGGYVSAKAENSETDGNAVGIWSTGKTIITNGKVYASGTGNPNISGFGIYSDISIEASGGDITAAGITQAVSHAPDLTKYEKPIISASSDFNGEMPTEYNAENIENYKYLHISHELYSITYDNQAIKINAPQAIKATVVFSSYNNLGRISAFEIKDVSLSQGINNITPDTFDFSKGTVIKIMLWSDIGNIKPLCSPEVFSTTAQTKLILVK